MNIIDFANMKQQKQKISMITCYDYTSALIAAQTNVDCLLVGDSLAMTMHGFKETMSATLDMMCLHAASVKRGAPNKFIIADMPFLSYRKSLDQNIVAVQSMMQTGVDAIKIENADGNLELIKHLVQSGIPVMGHLGLTPQLALSLGGYKVQGRTDESAEKIKQDAFLLEKAGCFSIVLECIPAKLAADITTNLTIPTIGIGAGHDTDGQVLVFQDMLGLNPTFKPKFVKLYLSGFSLIQQSINQYVDEVKMKEFPNDEHSY